MSFTKTNMLYNHYSWTAMKGDDPKISGVPDSTLFNRNEGYEVLYLINKIMDSQSWVNVTTGQKIEKMFKTGLPGPERGQKNVINWVVSNWDKY